MQPKRTIAPTLVSAAIALIASAILAGCASVPRSIETPEVQLASLSLVSAEADGQTFALVLRLENANSIPVPIEQVRVDVRLGGEGYLSGVAMGAVVIPALGSEQVLVEVETDRVSSQSRLMAMVQGPQDALPYELEGELNVGGRPPRLLAFQHRGMVPFSVRLGN